MQSSSNNKGERQCTIYSVTFDQELQNMYDDAVIHECAAPSAITSCYTWVRCHEVYRYSYESHLLKYSARDLVCYSVLSTKSRFLHLDDTVDRLPQWVDHLLFCTASTHQLLIGDIWCFRHWPFLNNKMAYISQVNDWHYVLNVNKVYIIALLKW